MRFATHAPAFTEPVYLYWGSPLAPCSSTLKRYSSSSAPVITTGLPFHFLLNQLQDMSCTVRFFSFYCNNFYICIYTYDASIFAHKKHTHNVYNHFSNATDLATPFPGVPPHHATSAWPLMIFPSTSSPLTSRFTTFGIPLPLQDRKYEEKKRKLEVKEDLLARHRCNTETISKTIARSTR